MATSVESAVAPKAALGTPLAEARILDDQQVRQLRALSVTTVEEMLGLVTADPEAAAEFLGLEDLAQLQADAVPVAQAELASAVLTDEEPQFAMGAVPPEDAYVEERASLATFREYASEAEQRAQSVESQAQPSVFLDCFGSVRHQRARGTCVAHAVCALLECLHTRSGEGEIDLSEQFVYWDAKEHDGRPSTEGTFVEVAMARVEADGACEEAVWLYNPNPIAGNEGQGPPPEGAEEAAAAHRATRVRQLGRRAPEEIRQVLDEGRPVAISVPVYRNWLNNNAVHVYGLIPMPLPTSKLEGGHAMCVAGYGFAADITGGAYFIVRNSWGAGWAAYSRIAPGYGVIPFLYIEKYGWEAFTAG
jgi:C1A family cysteine protease